ncbi:GtrA family protein [uncultured Methanospirillum sp.]|uniref:GtrA family protein n=1 Tax=uncultured Methanospirillum sp. TaxID=262503 RepID=UPI0029C88B03|nr:GtrA family protein [uncultured Methanospirillum sp.]
MPDFPCNTGEKENVVLLSCLGEHLGAFLLIGIFTTCVDIGLLWFLTEKIGLWYLVSATGSYCTGSLLSYSLNKSLNYRNQSKNYVRQGSSFLIIAASSFSLNLAVLSISVEIFQVHYLIAKAGATIVAFLWNYYAQTTITFRIWK